MSNVTESLSGGGLMKALRLDSYDASPLLEVEVAKPSPQQGQVLVKIKASGVNPIDYKIRLGRPLTRCLSYQRSLALIWLASLRQWAKALLNSKLGMRCMV